MRELVYSNALLEGELRQPAATVECCLRDPSVTHAMLGRVTSLANEDGTSHRTGMKRNGSIPCSVRWRFWIFVACPGNRWSYLRQLLFSILNISTGLICKEEIDKFGLYFDRANHRPDMLRIELAGCLTRE